MKKINGTIFRSYHICKRQAWLVIREMNPDQEDGFLELGRMIHENSYKRTKKEIIFDGCKFDLIDIGKEKTIIGEIKKSSKAMQSSILQLKFYLYILNKKGIKVTGEIRVPTEKNRISIVLNDEDISNIEKLIDEMNENLNKDKIPQVTKNKYCKNCAYKDFCWS